MKRFSLALLFALLAAGCTSVINFEGILTYQEWSLPVNTGSGLNPDNDIVFLIDNSESMQDEIQVLKNSLAELTDRLGAEANLKYRLIGVPFSASSWNVDWFSRGMESTKLQMWSGYTIANQNALPSFHSFLSGLTTAGSPPEAGIALAGRMMDLLYQSSSSTNKKVTHFVLLSDEDDQKTISMWNPNQNKNTDYRIQLTTADESRFQISWDYRGKYYLYATNLCRKKLPTPYEGYSYTCSQASGGPEVRHSTDNRDIMLCSVPEYFKCQQYSDNQAIRDIRFRWRNLSYDSEFGSYLDYSMGSVWNTGNYIACQADSNVMRRELVSKGFNAADVRCKWGHPGFDMNWCLDRANWVYPPGIDTNTCEAVSCQQNWYSNDPVKVGDGINTTLSSFTQAECAEGFEKPYPYVHIQSDRPILVTEEVRNNLPSNAYFTQSVYAHQTKSVVYPGIKTAAEALAEFKAANPTATDATIEDRSRSSGDQRANTHLPAIMADGNGLKQFVTRFYPQNTVTFSAIVAKEDGYCSDLGSSGNQNVKGTMYLEAAAVLRGVDGGDICAPEFDKFMENLAAQIKLFNKPNFLLPSWADPKLFLVVTDVRTGRLFKEGKDFILDKSRMNIYFNENAVAPNQDILIELYK